MIDYLDWLEACHPQPSDEELREWMTRQEAEEPKVLSEMQELFSDVF